MEAIIQRLADAAESRGCEIDTSQVGQGSERVAYKVNVKGQVIRVVGCTLFEAAQQVAKVVGGSVVFSCPNYAVVAVGRDEVTIWMK